MKNGQQQKSLLTQAGIRGLNVRSTKRNNTHLQIPGWRYGQVHHVHME
jgi:hypothetical protein